VLTPYFGYSGTITPVCSGLPKYSICAFQPVTAVVSGTAQVPFTVYIYTNVAPLARIQDAAGSRVALAILSPFGLLALVFGRRRRLVGRQLWLAMFLVFSLVGTVVLGGCTNPVITANPSAVTPASSQAVTVTFADNNTPQVTHSINFTLNVCNINVGTTCQTF
jgi:hypothetical protein